MKSLTKLNIKRFIKDNTWGHDEISKWAIIPVLIFMGLIFWRMVYYGNLPKTDFNGFMFTLEIWTLILLLILICKRNFKIK